MSKIKLIVALHKEFKTPDNSIYVPLELGAATRENHFLELRDDSGDNISARNPNYCELTGLYWAYKNLTDYDIIGLVHYRRYFMKSDFCFRKKLENVITSKEIEKALAKKDIILPKKRHYYIETNYSHYIHSHKKAPIDEVRKVIEEYYSEYLSSFDKHMKRRTGHYFNMFIAKKEVAIPLLDFIFGVIFKLDGRVDISSWSIYERRIYGFISELLFDVYVDKNKLTVKNQKYLFFEKQNWFKKIYIFLKKKYTYKKGD